jgi:hypothetical protein
VTSIATFPGSSEPRQTFRERVPIIQMKMKTKQVNNKQNCGGSRHTKFFQKEFDFNRKADELEAQWP